MVYNQNECAENAVCVQKSVYNLSYIVCQCLSGYMTLNGQCSSICITNATTNEICGGNISACSSSGCSNQNNDDGDGDDGKNKNNNMLWIIIGVVCGVVVIAAVVVTLLLIKKKKGQNANKKLDLTEASASTHAETQASKGNKGNKKVELAL